MSDSTLARSSGAAKRRARTHRALIEAAQKLLAEGRRSSASIQEITDTAEVGFGSFYNHFDSKDELFDIAVVRTLDALGVQIDRGTKHMDDPAEVFAARIRLTGRLVRSYPELTRVVLRGGPRFLFGDTGVGGGARRDIDAAIAAGRLDVKDTGVVLAATTGALLGLAQLLDDEPERDAAMTSDRVAERLLIGMGVTPAEAAELIARPLPELF